jgi:predicted lipoprotein with Yx(FWY)xxD motif
MSTQRSLTGLAALIGLFATQACSSDATSGNGSSAGSAGQPSSVGGQASAGAPSSQAGGSGAPAGGSGNSAAGAAAGGTSGAAAGGSSGAATGGTSGAAAGGSSGAATGGSSGAATGGTGGAAAGGSSGTGGSTAADTFTEQTTAGGPVVATAQKLTLYFYQPDTPAAGATPAVSTCMGACLTHWPLYYGNPVTVPAGLNASDFGSFDRGAGVMQSTYHGWPVYTYDDDMVAGDAKGDLEKAAGKIVWYAIRLPFTAPMKP